MLKYVPDHLETKEMCNEVCISFRQLFILFPIASRLKRCALKQLKQTYGSWIMSLIAFKTQKMCDATVSEDPYSLQYFPDWFVTQGQVRKLRDDDNYCDDDEIIERYDDYKKRKAQKAEIKEELMSIA